jgi:hypothetical protein
LCHDWVSGFSKFIWRIYFLGAILGFLLYHHRMGGCTCINRSACNRCMYVLFPVRQKTKWGKCSDWQIISQCSTTIIYTNNTLSTSACNVWQLQCKTWTQQ